MEDEGYDSDLDLKAEYDWEDTTVGKIKERLGIEEWMDDYDEEGSGKNNDDLGCTLLFVLLLRLDLDCHRNLCITRNTAYYRMVTPSQGSHITMFGAQ